MENEVMQVQNTSLPGIKHSEKEISKAIKQFGLENFPVPEELKGHIVELAEMENILSAMNVEVRNVEKEIKHFEQTVSDVSNGIINSSKDVGKIAGDITSAFGGDKKTGKAYGELAAGVGGLLVGIVGDVIAGKKRSDLSKKKQEREEQLLEERKVFAEAKLPQIKSLMPIFEKNKFEILYQAEMEKEYSLTDKLLDKKESAFKLTFFLYAKMEYLKELATFFIDTFEHWRRKDAKKMKHIKMPSFDEKINSITDKWDVINRLGNDKFTGNVPMYMVTALKEPYITSRLIETDKDEYHCGKIQVYSDSLDCEDFTTIPDGAKKILQNNPVYKEIKKLKYPEYPKEFSTGDFLISAIVLILFGFSTFAQIHWLGKLAFATLPLTGIAMCFFANCYSFVLPMTIRENVFDRQRDEYNKDVQKIIKKQSFKL